MKIEECGIVLTTQNSRIHWCIDSGFSRHMTGNKNTFRTLQEKEGTMMFGNDNPSRILGKGKVSLGSKDASSKNVLLIKNMNHNILSVIQMCDQGHILIFISKDCEIRKEGTKKLVEMTVRNPNNIYILNDIGKERCCSVKEDKSFL